jgi:transketolase
MRAAVFAVAQHQGPVYLRLYREPTPVFTEARRTFRIGAVVVEREGKDVTVVGCGPQVATALQVAGELHGKVSVEVINCGTLQPIDRETILASARVTGRVVTIEDHNVNGGLGSAVAEILCEAGFGVSLRRVGLRSFGESGPYAALTKKLGIDAAGLTDAIRDSLRAKE